MACESDQGNSSTFTSEESSSDSEGCSSDSGGGMFIVEKILAHHSYGHLKRRNMIDEGRPQADYDIFFLVRWEGYGSEDDSWEPWQTVEKLDVFKRYVRKHKADLKAFSRRARETFGCKNDGVKEKRKKHRKSSDGRERERYSHDGDDECQPSNSLDRNRRLSNGSSEKNSSNSTQSHSRSGVRWEGYGSEDDSWEPWQTVEKLDVFKRYVRKHKADLKAFSRRARETFGCKNDGVKEKRKKHRKSSDGRERERYSHDGDDECQPSNSLDRNRRLSNGSSEKNSSNSTQSHSRSGHEKKNYEERKRVKKRRISEERERERQGRKEALSKIIEKRRRLEGIKKTEVSNAAATALDSSSDNELSLRMKQPLRIIVSSDDEMTAPEASTMVTPTSEREEAPPLTTQVQTSLTSDEQLQQKQFVDHSGTEHLESDEDGQMCIEVGCAPLEEQRTTQEEVRPAPVCRRKYVGEVEDGFVEYKRRTRSTSPMVDHFVKERMARKYSNGVKMKHARDDLVFRERTSKVELLTRSELNTVGERFSEGQQTIRSLKELPLKERRNFADRLKNTSTKHLEEVINDATSKSNAMAVCKGRMRQSLNAANLRDFLLLWNYLEKDLLHNGASSDTLDWILNEVCMRDANDVSPFGDLLRRSACSSDHNICGLLGHILSHVSPSLRERLLEELRDRNGNAALAQAITIAVSGDGPCVIDVLLRFGANINSGRITALQKCVEGGHREMLVYLLRKGADATRLKCFESTDFFSGGGRGQYANPLLWHLVRFIDRFNATFNEWTSSVLSKELPSDLVASPISAVHPYRIVQLDKRVFIKVVSREALDVQSSTVRASFHQITILVIHMCQFAHATDIASLCPERRPILVHLPDTIRVRLGATCEGVDLGLVARTSHTLVYQFPKCFHLESGTRVHVNLSYSLGDTVDDDSLLAFGLWVAQTPPPVIENK
ncbi:hypothetical protein Tcan_06075 [Toxocara canis]|uniref:Chromo domain-containing protein n=1 Tax=Toxocara canis TaxID=6265 RepID=A0A0B2VHL1_TOXCA|nr:hypothetical protein Tcan_06075 [Toxocara canis]